MSLVSIGSYRDAEAFDTVESMAADTRVYRHVGRRNTAIRQSKGTCSGRGPIVRHSAASRQRALTFLRNGPTWATFATLTFPYPVTDGREAKKHLDRLLARLVRRGISAFWSLEFQSCGRLHYHLLLTESVSLADLQVAWKSVLGFDGYVHVHASRVEDQQAVCYYAIKAKGHRSHAVPEGFSNPGRLWGTRGPEAKAQVLLKLVAPRDVVARVWRPLRNLYASYARRLGKRRGHDQGVAGWYLWGLGGADLAIAVVRLIERVVAKFGWKQFHIQEGWSAGSGVLVVVHA